MPDYLHVSSISSMDAICIVFGRDAFVWDRGEVGGISRFGLSHGRRGLDTEGIRGADYAPTTTPIKESNWINRVRIPNEQLVFLVA